MKTALVLTILLSVFSNVGFAASLNKDEVKNEIQKALKELKKKEGLEFNLEMSRDLIAKILKENGYEESLDNRGGNGFGLTHTTETGLEYNDYEGVVYVFCPKGVTDLQKCMTLKDVQKKKTTIDFN